MAPSLTEDVQKTTEQIASKLAAVGLTHENPTAETPAAVSETSAPAVQAAVVEPETPVSPETDDGVYPRAPLKLSGALDQFKSFDVTPVIGREFVDVDLVEWLNAPNSDELIRDLAITSMCQVFTFAGSP
jgi:hypothetical protein